MIPELEDIVKENKWNAGSKFIIKDVESILDTLIELMKEAEKQYQSYTGFDQAYRYLRGYDHSDPLVAASGIAANMSKVANKMTTKMKEIVDSFKEEPAVENIPDLVENLRYFTCDELFCNDSFVFAVDEWLNDGRSRMAIIEELVYEAMRFDLCDGVRRSIETRCDHIMSNLDKLMASVDDLGVVPVSAPK